MATAGTSTTQMAVRYVFNNPATSSVRLTITVAYLFTFVVGVVANGLVIYVLAVLQGSTSATRPMTTAAAGTTGQHRSQHRDRRAVIRTKSVANCYIANLAAADLIFVCTLPLFCWATYASDWPFGVGACKTAYAVRESNKFVGVYVLVALSVDRYLASHYDLGRWRTVTVGRIVCLVIWLSCAVATAPYWIHAQVTGTVSEATGNGSRSCRMLWPIESSADDDDGGGDLLPSSQSPRVTGNPGTLYSATHSAWTRSQFVVGFVLPFAIIVTSYTALGVRLQRLLAIRNACSAAGTGGTTRPNVIPETSSGNVVGRSAVPLIKRPGRAMTRMTVAVTVMFLVTQLPYYVFELIGASKAEQLHETAKLHHRQYHQQQQQVFKRQQSDDDDVTPVSSTSDLLSSAFVTSFSGLSLNHSVSEPSVTRLVPTLSPATSADIAALIWLNAIVKMLQFVSCCFNPVIYGLMNRNYRALYSEVLFRRYACCRRVGARFNLVMSSARHRVEFSLSEVATVGGGTRSRPNAAGAKGEGCEGGSGDPSAGAGTGPDGEYQSVQSRSSRRRIKILFDAIDCRADYVETAEAGLRGSAWLGLSITCPSTSVTFLDSGERTQLTPVRLSGDGEHQQQHRFSEDESA